MSTTASVKQETPLVTLGVASYNNARFIAETLDSIAAQNYPHLEVFIHDDASTDHSVAVIQAWMKNHPALRVQLMTYSTNAGICVGLNRMLQASNGDLISFIASDDRYLPDFVQNRVKAFSKFGPETGIVYSRSWLMDEHGQRTGQELRPMWPSGWIFKDLCTLQNSFCKPFTSMVRRSVYETVGGYDENLLFEDMDFFFRVSREFRIEYIESPDTEYRVLPESLGSKIYTTERGLEAMSQLLCKQLGISPETDKLLARRFRKIALLKKDLGVSNWKEDMQRSINESGSLTDRLYLNWHPVMDHFRKE